MINSICIFYFSLSFIVNPKIVLYQISHTDYYQVVQYYNIKLFLELAGLQAAAKEPFYRPQ